MSGGRRRSLWRGELASGAWCFEREWDGVGGMKLVQRRPSYRRSEYGTGRRRRMEVAVPMPLSLSLDDVLTFLEISDG